MRKMNLLIILTAITASVAANAGIPLKDLPKVRSADWYPGFALGLGEGLTQANAALNLKQRELLFCPPENLSLNLTNFTQMIDEFYLETSKIDKLMDVATVEYALLYKLQQNFPCKL